MGRKHQKNKGVRLVDVAAEAGVSAITVSRALRNPEIVTESTRARVEAAVARLGYAPDPAASALASARTDVIALIVPSLTNSVFGDVLRGIYDLLPDTPYSIQIGNSRYAPGREELLIRTFLRQKPAGMIVSGMDQTTASLALLRDAPCPVVQIMDHGPAPVDMSVGLSHIAGAEQAVAHLLDQGYCRPGFLGARMDPRSQQRLKGFSRAAQAAGAYNARRVLTTAQPSSVGMGRTLLADLLSRAPDTDAILCNNDDLAAGALLEAQRRHIDVPRDLGICGFNDLEFARHMNPPLSTVATPRYQIGAQALQMVLSALKDGTRPDSPCVDLGIQLIPRESTDRQGRLPA